MCNPQWLPVIACVSLCFSLRITKRTLCMTPSVYQKCINGLAEVSVNHQSTMYTNSLLREPLLYPVLMAMISTSGFFLTFGRLRSAPPVFRPSRFFWPNSRTVWPFSVSSTTSTTRSICCTPIKLKPWWNQQQAMREINTKYKGLTFRTTHLKDHRGNINYVIELWYDFELCQKKLHKQ